MLKNIDNLFRAAVIKKDLIKLKALVNNSNYSFDLDQTVLNGSTALHLAVANKNMFMTRLLLANGASLELKTKYGDSCLHLAARVNNVEFVNLYARRMNVDAANSAGNTALHIAVLCNNYGIVETLLKARAKIDEQNYRGQTPLHVAVNKKFVRPIKLLLKYRADANILDREGYTAFHICFYRFEDEELLSCFLKHGADPNVRTHLGENALHLTVKHEYEGRMEPEEDLKIIQKSGKTVDPSVEMMLRVMRLLVRHGVDVNAEDNFGSTPLYIAFCSRKPKVFEYLLSEGADINCSARCRPIFTAVENEDVRMIRYLVDRDVDASLKNDRRENILKVAMRCIRGEKKCFEVVKLLLGNGANFDEDGDSQQLTILETAMLMQNLDILRLLIKHGAPVNERNKNQESPLYFAVKRDLYEAALILTEKGADVTDYDADNVSILSLAISEDNERMVKLIFDNIEVMDSRVFWYIEDIKSADMLKLLENRLRRYGRPYLNGPDGVPILVHAINSCQPAMVNYILNKGVNLNVEYKSFVPLVWARSAYLENGGCRASKEIVYLLIRQLALLSSQNLHIHKANAELIQCNCWMFDYYLECHQELELMRDTKICRGSSLTYYDILTKRCNGLIRCLRQDAIVEKLDSGGYREVFNIYADKLQFNYACGLQWIQEMDEFRNVLMDSLGDVLLYDVICEVNQYYNDKDYAKCLKK